jgi:hypothetical protein
VKCAQAEDGDDDGTVKTSLKDEHSGGNDVSVASQPKEGGVDGMEIFFSLFLWFRKLC